MALKSDSRAQLGLFSEVQAAPPQARVILAIRESRRARRLILQTLPPRTVELVVPYGTRPRIVQTFLGEHRVWIERAGSELLASFPEPDLMPRRIRLEAVGEDIAVQYRVLGDGSSRYLYGDGTLELFHREADVREPPRLLRRWLLEQGRRVLKPWLLEEAGRTGLRPAGVQIRLQRTRWGSCSARASVSLNAALLLVEPELVRYLFIHELCHLEHMSHSRRYWRSVAAIEPAYRELDRRLAARWQTLPAWVLPPARDAGTC